MMAMRSTVRVYSTEVGRQHALGSLRRYGWVVSNTGTRVIDGTTVYTITCHRPWPSVGLLLQAMQAARDAFMRVMRGTNREAA